MLYTSKILNLLISISVSLNSTFTRKAPDGLWKAAWRICLIVQFVGPQFEAEKLNSVYKLEYTADIFNLALRFSGMKRSTG